MKKFSTENKTKIEQFASNQVLYNKIYDIVDACLVPMVENNINNNLFLTGKKELVIELAKIVENAVNLEKIGLIENISNFNKINNI